MEDKERLQERVLLLEASSRRQEEDIKQMKQEVGGIVKKLTALESSVVTKIDSNHNELKGLFGSVDTRLKVIENDRKEDSDKLSNLIKYELPKLIITVITTALLTSALTLIIR